MDNFREFSILNFRTFTQNSSVWHSTHSPRSRAAHAHWTDGWSTSAPLLRPPHFPTTANEPKRLAASHTTDRGWIKTKDTTDRTNGTTDRLHPSTNCHRDGRKGQPKANNDLLLCHRLLLQSSTVQFGFSWLVAAYNWLSVLDICQLQAATCSPYP
jgi:hypothetical protein